VASNNCKHYSFETQAHVHRQESDSQVMFSVEFKVICKDCGMPANYVVNSPDRRMEMSPDRLKLTAPIEFNPENRNTTPTPAGIPE
jgi:hypothetical protein